MAEELVLLEAFQFPLRVLFHDLFLCFVSFLVLFHVLVPEVLRKLSMGLVNRVFDDTTRVSEEEVVAKVVEDFVCWNELNYCWLSWKVLR